MQRIPRPLVLPFLLVAAVCGAALPTAVPAEEPTPATEELAPSGADYDPLQKMNRGIFWFNDHADQYVLEPAAKGWNFVVPQGVQNSLSDFFANLRFPVVMVNNLLQGKVQPAAVDVSRFMVNTTFGIAGFFDPASDWGLERHHEDFGQTLGVWGVPPGPYLVLPLFGPSNPRDTGALAVDYVLSVTPLFAPGYATISAGAVNAVNARAQVIEEVKDAKEASLDYYVFVRNAYHQRRDALIHDQKQDERDHAPTDDLYDLNTIDDAK